MKSLILALAATLSMASLAQAETQCAFGEETWELDEAFESEDTGKLWYKGEHVSLANPQRIKGLTAFERQMILSTMSYDQGQEEAALLDFQSSDGYITYFHPNADRRVFAIVASYPGDNEFGQILEVHRNARGEYTKTDIVGVISDGFIEDCQVKKSEIR